LPLGINDLPHRTGPFSVKTLVQAEREAEMLLFAAAI
jgi:hypothetical protein